MDGSSSMEDGNVLEFRLVAETEHRVQGGLTFPVSFVVEGDLNTHCIGEENVKRMPGGESG